MFEWDDDKAAENVIKHGVWFAEAATVFNDYLASLFPDMLHSGDEDRYIALGKSSADRLLTVVHTERDGKIRIISARLATRRERREYEESNE